MKQAASPQLATMTIQDHSNQKHLLSLTFITLSFRFSVVKDGGCCVALADRSIYPKSYSNHSLPASTGTHYHPFPKM
jgi:hypothetical protein